MGNGNTPLDLSEFGGTVVTPTAAPAESAVPLDLSEFGGKQVTPTPSAGGSSGSWDQPAQSQSTGSSVVQALRTAEGVKQGVERGFVKGIGDTVSGVAHLIHHIPGGVGEFLSPEGGITNLDSRDVTDGTSEMVGKGIEGIAEFAAGDEALEGLSKASKLVALAKKYPAIAEVLNMAKNHPILAKLITGAGKGATVGAFQGAVKGAQKDASLSEAEAGAAGGAIGGAAGEGIGALAGKGKKAATDQIAKLFGLGGLTSEEAATAAGRPSVREGAKFAAAWEDAKPVVQSIPKKSIKTVGDFEDALGDKADQLWQDTIQPRIDRNANNPNAAIDGNEVAKRILQSIDEKVGMRDMFPEEVAPIEAMAKRFQGTGKLSADKAAGYLKTLNAQLKEFYRMSPDVRAAKGLTNGRLSSMEEAADAIRDQLYDNLDTVENLKPGTTRGQSRQYGSLRDLERVFGKRATVADRQAPYNIQQIFGAMESVAALASGHPLAAAAGVVPTIYKQRNAPENLIRRGISAAKEEISPSGTPIRNAVSAAARTGAAPAASLAAQSRVPQGLPDLQPGFVRVQDSAGGVHDVPQERLSDVQQRDPGLQVIDSK